MAKKVLVTYASRTGTTEGVAKAIGQELSAHGFYVDILTMKNVNDLTPYNAIVAGCAIQGGKWLPEAMDFIQSHRKVIETKPFAAFLVCMTLAMPKADKYRSFVETWMVPIRSLVKPVSEGFFSGSLYVRKVKKLSDRFKFRLSVLFGVWKEGDHRDWNAIREWASNLIPLL